MTCLFLLSPTVVLSETVKYEDLVERDGLYYKKFSDVPFTGTSTGEKQGVLHNGKKHGLWKVYWDNGQLRQKAVYKDGILDGLWVSYFGDGKLYRKVNYKDGYESGPLTSYHYNGQLDCKGTYQKGKWEDLWMCYNRDGTTNSMYTGTYKNGKKVSD